MKTKVGVTIILIFAILIYVKKKPDSSELYLMNEEIDDKRCYSFLSQEYVVYSKYHPLNCTEGYQFFEQYLLNLASYSTKIKAKWPDGRNEISIVTLNNLNTFHVDYKEDLYFELNDFEFFRFSSGYYRSNYVKKNVVSELKKEELLNIEGETPFNISNIYSIPSLSVSNLGVDFFSAINNFCLSFENQKIIKSCGNKNTASKLFQNIAGMWYIEVYIGDDLYLGRIDSNQEKNTLISSSCSKWDANTVMKEIFGFFHINYNKKDIKINNQIIQSVEFECIYDGDDEILILGRDIFKHILNMEIDIKQKEFTIKI